MVRMKVRPRVQGRGQASVEYALILSVVAIAVLLIVTVLGARVRGMYEVSLEGLQNAMTTGESSSGIQATMEKFLGLISDFQAENGRWPRSWGDYKFTDLGLNTDDWSDTVEGIIWNPNGDKIGLANQSGDDLQVYVDTLSGETLKLYDGWNVWCPVGDSNCYYHTVEPGNEVDISTMVVVEES